MDIGHAVDAMKAGARVTRLGWNGKDMWLYYVAPGKYLPTSPVAVEHWGDQPVPYNAYVAMKTVDGTVVPWLCSQTDLLATDWRVVA